MSEVTENRITDITEVRHFRLVKKEAILQLTGVSDNTAITNDYVLTNVSIVPNLAVSPNNRRTFDHCAIFNNGSHANKDLLSDECPSLAFVIENWTRVQADVLLDSFQSRPSLFAAPEEGCVLRLLQIEQVRRFKHAVKAT